MLFLVSPCRRAFWAQGFQESQRDVTHQQDEYPCVVDDHPGEVYVGNPSSNEDEGVYLIFTLLHDDVAVLQRGLNPTEPQGKDHGRGVDEDTDHVLEGVEHERLLECQDAPCKRSICGDEQNLEANGVCGEENAIDDRERIDPVAKIIQQVVLSLSFEGEPADKGQQEHLWDVPHPKVLGSPAEYKACEARHALRFIVDAETDL